MLEPLIIKMDCSSETRICPAIQPIKKCAGAGNFVHDPEDFEPGPLAWKAKVLTRLDYTRTIG